MSLAIDTDEITHVLLADGWHTVEWSKHDDDSPPVSTFDFDAYEFLWYGRSEERRRDFNPLTTYQPRDESTGFSFLDADLGRWIVGPMSSIIAVSRLPT